MQLGQLIIQPYFSRQSSPDSSHWPSSLHSYPESQEPQEPSHPSSPQTLPVQSGTRISTCPMRTSSVPWLSNSRQGHRSSDNLKRILFRVLLTEETGQLQVMLTDMADKKIGEEEHGLGHQPEACAPGPDLVLDLP